MFKYFRSYQCLWYLEFLCLHSGIVWKAGSLKYTTVTSCVTVTRSEAASKRMRFKNFIMFYYLATFAMMSLLQTLDLNLDRKHFAYTHLEIPTDTQLGETYALSRKERSTRLHPYTFPRYISEQIVILNMLLSILSFRLTAFTVSFSFDRTTPFCVLSHTV